MRRYHLTSRLTWAGSTAFGYGMKLACAPRSRKTFPHDFYWYTWRVRLFTKSNEFGVKSSPKYSPRRGNMNAGCEIRMSVDMHFADGILMSLTTLVPY